MKSPDSTSFGAEEGHGGEKMAVEGWEEQVGLTSCLSPLSALTASDSTRVLASLLAWQHSLLSLSSH